MWPWGHLAVGYLLYATYTRYRHLGPPSGWAVVWLAIGTQFPDLVDKPLAYWTPILPAGRALAHSVLVAIPVVAAVLWLGYRRGLGRSAAAFALGYATHLPADALGAFLSGEGEELTFLLWPLLPAPEYEATGFEHHARRLTEAVSSAERNRLTVLAPWEDPIVAQVWLFVAALVLWLIHGAPPLGALGRRLRGRSSTGGESR